MGKRSIKIYQVDGFTNRLFKGNPAAVCILDEPIEDRIMQSIALEMNLSETAFILHKEKNIFQLRWFTPKTEVDLCGHATLGASEVLFNGFNLEYNDIVYETKSGRLKIRKDTTGIILDFPSDEPVYNKSVDVEGLLKAMDIQNYKRIFYGKRTNKLVLHMDKEEDIVKIRPNFEDMKKLNLKDIKGVAVTAESKGKYDFTSRYFNPWAGVNEDPVTGSVHTLLATYWSDILGKKILNAYQASDRSGEIGLRLKCNNRLELIGEAVIVLKGEIYI